MHLLRAQPLEAVSPPYFLLSAVELANAQENMIGKNIVILARAMAEFEGWYPANSASSSYPQGTLAYRFHNPGNLRASPLAYANQNGFAVFYNDDLGWSAFYWDLMKKCKGETVTGLTPNSTLADLIYKFAPPEENKPEEYIEHIVIRTGWLRTKKLADICADI